MKTHTPKNITTGTEERLRWLVSETPEFTLWNIAGPSGPEF